MDEEITAWENTTRKYDAENGRMKISGRNDGEWVSASLDGVFDSIAER